MRRSIPVIALLLTLAACARGQGKMGKDAVAPLAKALRQDERASARRLAALALGAIGAPASEAAPELAKALAQDRSFRVRRAVADVLREVDPQPKDVLDALANTL